MTGEPPVATVHAGSCACMHERPELCSGPRVGAHDRAAALMTGFWCARQRCFKGGKEKGCRDRVGDRVWAETGALRTRQEFGVTTGPWGSWMILGRDLAFGLQQRQAQLRG